MANPNIFDELSRGLADAITDIREKVLEEPMWGRPLSNQHTELASQWPAARETEPAHRADHELDRDRGRNMEIDR
jgi:hypothetical protein